MSILDIEHGTNVLDINCEAGEGSILANILRRYIVGNCKTWRPIAFQFRNDNPDSIGANSAVISNNIIESFMKFQSSFLKLDFEIDVADQDLYYEIYKFNNTFTSKDLNTSAVKCTPDNVGLLQATNNQDVTFTVYYRKSFGAHSAEDNYDFIKERKGENFKIDFPTVASVHYAERRCVSYTVDSFDTKDIIHMSMTGCPNPEQLIEEAKSHIINSIQNLEIK